MCIYLFYFDFKIQNSTKFSSSSFDCDTLLTVGMPTQYLNWVYNSYCKAKISISKGESSEEGIHISGLLRAIKEKWSTRYKWTIILYLE